MFSRSVLTLICLSLILLISGAAGLSYEVVWLRLLANTLGSSSLATSTILAVFMGGMAIGSLVLGRSADSLDRPLMLYAVLELLLGLCALAVPQGLTLVQQLDGWWLTGSSGWGAVFSKAASSAALLFVPTFLMGGTIPAIGAAVSRYQVRAGVWFTLLYGVHVFGAAAGTLLASFVLIPAWGLTWTSSVGAVANGVAALGAVFVVWHERASVPAKVRPTISSGSAPSRVSQVAWLTTACLIGFILLGSEVVFVRTLVLTLSAKVHSFALMLAVFLVALSLGSFLAGLLPDRVVQRPECLGIVFLVGALGFFASRELTLIAPLHLIAAAYIPDEPLAKTPAALAPLVSLVTNSTFRMQSGEYVATSVAVAALSLMPFAVPLGMVLPIIIRCAGFTSMRSGSAVGSVIFWNMVGCVVGPLIAAFLLVPKFSLHGTLWLFALLAAVAGACWIAISIRQTEIRKRPGLILGGSLLATLVGISIAISSPRFDGTPALDATQAARDLRRQVTSEVLHHREGPTCTVTVIDSPGRERSLRLDGYEAAGNHSVVYQYMRMMAHLPMLLRGPDEVERVLVICCGTGGTAGAASLYPVEELVLVDLHREVLDCLPWFSAWNHDLADNPRCRKLADDGRAHLRAKQGWYDVITLEPMPPQFAGMTQLYSVEFYDSCRRAMRSGGVVCQWLPYHLVMRDQGLSIVRSMVAVFPTVQVWDYKQMGILIGTTEASLSLDLNKVKAALAHEKVKQDLLNAGLGNAMTLLDHYLCEEQDLAEVLHDIHPIHDDHPLLEYENVLHGHELPPIEEQLKRCQPYWKARLDSQVPLAGLDDASRAQVQQLWRRSGVVRYADLLRRTDSPAAALRFIGAEQANDSDLSSLPQFQQLLKKLEAAASEP